MEFQIRLNSVEEAVKLVNWLERFECQADAWMGRCVIDARSLMGLLGFGIGKVIRLVIHSEMSEDLETGLQDFLAA